MNRPGNICLLLLAGLATGRLAAAPPPPAGSAAPRTQPPVRSKPLATADPQSLVSRGKLPPFYDPRDLSRPPVLSAKAAVLMDADTGQILWEKNGGLRRAPASTTKILTGLLFVEHTPPEDIITCLDPKIGRFEGSSLHLKPWEKLTAEDLLYALMLRSANDGAVVIAQHVAGSVPKFAARMNARARELGATDSHFTNPNGLPDPKHYTTARDLARIARAALAEPRFAQVVSTYRRTIERSKNKNDRVLVSKAKKFFHKLPGADGVKTGYTRAAGYCFVGSATRDNRRLLSVVLGARSSATVDTIPLLSWGFKRFPVVWVARKGDALGNIAITDAAAKVPVIAGDDLRATTDSTRPAPLTTTTVLEPVRAPIARGQVVGRLVAKMNGQAVGSVPLLAAADVARSPFALGATRSWPLIGWIAGGAALVLAGVHLGTTTTKGAGQRRHRVTAPRRSTHRRRPGRG